MTLSCYKTIASNVRGDFYSLSCFHSCIVQKIDLRNIKNHDYCNIEMLKEGNKILKYINAEKTTQFPFIVYA